MTGSDFGKNDTQKTGEIVHRSSTQVWLNLKNSVPIRVQKCRKRVWTRLFQKWEIYEGPAPHFLTLN